MKYAVAWRLPRGESWRTSYRESAALVGASQNLHAEFSRSFHSVAAGHFSLFLSLSLSLSWEQKLNISIWRIGPPRLCCASAFVAPLNGDMAAVRCFGRSFQPRKVLNGGTFLKLNRSIARASSASCAPLFFFRAS